MKFTKEMQDRIIKWVEQNGLQPQPCGATLISLCRACGYNKNTSEKLAHFFGMSMAEYLRWLWNNPQAGQSPYKMFEGIIAPSAEMGKDENGDLIYYYHKERTTNV